jgi:hypothetical protein
LRRRSLPVLRQRGQQLVRRMSQHLVLPPGRSRRVQGQEIIWVAAPFDPLAKVKNPSTEALLERPIISRELGSGTRRVMELALRPLILALLGRSHHSPPLFFRVFDRPLLLFISRPHVAWEGHRKPRPLSPPHIGRSRSRFIEAQRGDPAHGVLFL